ncbi:hypothetical protein HA402_000656 [Bradysia odoriphaga]|nr:hypothetical protein HA402_000656 [Bradysia odoriphaga]
MPLLHRSLTSYDIRNHFLDYIIKTSDPTITGSNFRKVFDRKKSACSGSVNLERHAASKQTDISKSLTSSHYSSTVQMRRNWSLGDYFEKGILGLAVNLFKGQCQNTSSRLYGTYFTDENEPLRDFIDIEMKNVLENSPKETHPFIVHFLTCATLLKSVKLQKATRLCTDRPIMVLSSTDNQIKARCCVPRNFVTNKFSAHLWLSTVAKAFQTEICSSPNELNIDEVCHIKPKELTSVVSDELIETAMLEAEKFAVVNM